MYIFVICGSIITACFVRQPREALSCEFSAHDTCDDFVRQSCSQQAARSLQGVISICVKCAGAVLVCLVTRPSTPAGPFCSVSACVDEYRALLYRPG